MHEGVDQSGDAYTNPAGPRRQGLRPADLPQITTGAAGPAQAVIGIQYYQTTCISADELSSSWNFHCFVLSSELLKFTL